VRAGAVWPAEEVRCTPIRKIRIVVDSEDPITPALPLKEFVKLFGRNPEPPRFRVISVEVLSCPEDQSVVLVSECDSCPRFIRRTGDFVYCAPKPVR